MINHKKIYYIILIIIIGLACWLVADFVQNKARADNILSDLPKPTPTDNPPPVPPLPILPQNINWPIMWGAKTEEVKTPPPTTALKPNFILTGIIIGPTCSNAFIKKSN